MDEEKDLSTLLLPSQKLANAIYFGSGIKPVISWCRNQNNDDLQIILEFDLRLNNKRSNFYASQVINQEKENTVDNLLPAFQVQITSHANISTSREKPYFIKVILDFEHFKLNLENNLKDEDFRKNYGLEDEGFVDELFKEGKKAVPSDFRNKISGACSIL